MAGWIWDGKLRRPRQARRGRAHRRRNLRPAIRRRVGGQLATGPRRGGLREKGSSVPRLCQRWEFLEKVTLSKARTSEVCANPTYRPDHKASLPPRAATLVGTPWDAAPRRPSVLDRNSPVYREAVSAWLREQGINDPKPTLSQLWRIDLEGDSRDEVLVAASRHRGSATSTVAGDYSVLLLRKLVGDKVATLPIASSLYPEACIAECALAVHEVFGALDLNGDGRLEIITKSSAYESITQAVHSVDGAHAVKRLEWTCGS